MYRLQLPGFDTRFDLTKVMEMPTTEETPASAGQRCFATCRQLHYQKTNSRRNQMLVELKNAKRLPEKIKKENEIEEELVGEIIEADNMTKGCKKSLQNLQNCCNQMLYLSLKTYKAN